MEQITKTIIEQLLSTDSPTFFKEFLIKDFTNLEAQLNHIKLMYGVELEVTMKPIEPKEQGRWLGKGMVEQITTFADLANKKILPPLTKL